MALQKVLVIDADRCTGCRQCELVCSYEHEGVYAPTLSRIRLVKFEDRCLNVPVVCGFCDKPPCEDVCPTGAMGQRAGQPYAVVREENCIGCKECVHACPLGAVAMHPRKGVAMRCDLCQGDPACVKVCAPGALRYEPLDAAVRQKRRARVVALGVLRSPEEEEC